MLYVLFVLIAVTICLFILLQFTPKSKNEKKDLKISDDSPRPSFLAADKSAFSSSTIDAKKIFQNISYIPFPESYAEKPIDDTEIQHILSKSDQFLNSSFNQSLNKRLSLLADDAYSTPKELADLISADPALSTKILQIANSPYFGFVDEIDSIFRAVVLMGQVQIKSIMSQYLFKKDVKELNEKQQYNFSKQWEKATIVSAIARYLVMIKMKQINNDPTTIALLHNLGKYYLFFIDPNYTTTDHPDIIMEEEKYGYNHGQIGSMICSKLGLPSSVSEFIRYHHYPSYTDIHNVPETVQFNVAIIYLSSMIAEIYLNEKDYTIYPMQQSYFDYLNLPSEIDHIITPALLTEIGKAKVVIDTLG